MAGGTPGPAVLVLAHFITAPRAGRRLAQRPAPEPVDRPEPSSDNRPTGADTETHRGRWSRRLDGQDDRQRVRAGLRVCGSCSRGLPPRTPNHRESQTEDSAYTTAEHQTDRHAAEDGQPEHDPKRNAYQHAHNKPCRRKRRPVLVIVCHTLIVPNAMRSGSVTVLIRPPSRYGLRRRVYRCVRCRACRPRPGMCDPRRRQRLRGGSPGAADRRPGGRGSSQGSGRDDGEVRFAGQISVARAESPRKCVEGHVDDGAQLLRARSGSAHDGEGLVHGRKVGREGLGRLVVQSAGLQRGA